MNTGLTLITNKIAFYIIGFTLLSTGVCTAQDTLWTREYHVGIYNQYDLRNSSINALTANRIMMDAFRKGIKPKMNEKLGNVTYGLYSFATTFFTMIWSHEFGHSLRTEQVGGHFKIHNAKVPIPYTTMHLPNNISLPDEALSVTGGFEVNYLNVRQIQREFIQQNGIYNEDLSFAFANRIMYPLYTAIITPINPNEKDVWINTAGDPVHVVLPVFKNFSGNRVFVQDSIVNPELVSFYRQSAILGSLFNLLDPQFYREVGAAFGKNKIRRPIFILGDYHTGWTFGTLFNVSPLGYELYMNNYVHVKDNKFSVYFKVGNPYKNNGIGFGWSEIAENRHMNLSAIVEAWDQDLFGKGISGEISLDIKLSKRLGINIITGYKTKGYVLGKQIDDGLNAGIGMKYYANYK